MDINAIRIVTWLPAGIFGSLPASWQAALLGHGSSSPITEGLQSLQKNLNMLIDLKE